MIIEKVIILDKSTQVAPYAVLCEASCGRHKIYPANAAGDGGWSMGY